MKKLGVAFSLIVALTALSGHVGLRGQVVPVHISNNGIYQFLDELAAGGVIPLNSLIRPYSRQTIAAKLASADTVRTELTGRQQRELDFYLEDYRKELPEERIAQKRLNYLWNQNLRDRRFDLFYYRDSLFRITVNPIVGADVWINNRGSFHHWWNGVEAWSYAGKFGFWASLRDNHESVELTARDYLNRRTGAANIKVLSGGQRDYEEFRGGITYAWKWGHVGLIMDQFAWGEQNAGSNIYSGRTPAFPRIELSLDPARWFSFTYLHGVLVSEVVDSTLSFYTQTSFGTEYRQVYHPKYLSANMFSFIPVKGLQLSVGNSVVYDFRVPHPGFVVPVAFYKAIDHTLNARIDNMNSQLYFSASSRNLRHFHMYGNVFIDELAVSRIFNSEEFNFVSYKGGISTTVLPDARLIAEYTWSNALTFRHYNPTTTFGSNGYNLGHYLEDNARDLYVGFEYRPVRAMVLKAWYNRSDKGPDHTALGSPRTTIEPFEPMVWESTRYGMQLTFQPFHDLYVRAGYERRNVTGEEAYLEQWTSEVYRGKTGTFRFGINYGF